MGMSVSVPIGLAHVPPDTGRWRAAGRGQRVEWALHASTANLQRVREDYPPDRVDVRVRLDGALRTMHQLTVDP